MAAHATICGLRIMLMARIAVRALRNAELFKYDHFRQAALAIAVGMLIQVIIQIPV